MDEDAKVPHYIEMWKQTVAVQQHFNDIEWRIRGPALTVMTFALGAAGVAAKDKTRVALFGWHAQLASLLLILGLLLWLAFYFVDQIWYHPLLIGAVRHGETLEATLQKTLPEAGLTKEISKSSPYPVEVGIWRLKYKFPKPLRSKGKMKFLYAAGAIVLLLPAIALQVAA